MRKLILILGPALFALIGLLAAYLSDPRFTVSGTVVGGVIGFGLSVFAVAGERD